MFSLVYTAQLRYHTTCVLHSIVAYYGWTMEQWVLKRYWRNCCFATRHSKNAMSNYWKSVKMWCSFHICTTPDPFSFRFFFFCSIFDSDSISHKWQLSHSCLHDDLACILLWSPQLCFFLCVVLPILKCGGKSHHGIVYKHSNHHLYAPYLPEASCIAGSFDATTTIV